MEIWSVEIVMENGTGEKKEWGGVSLSAELEECQCERGIVALQI